MTRRTHTIVQLTDTHLVGDGELLYGAVDAAANVERALDIVVERVGPIDALILTGDLANDGDAAAYRRLRKIVDNAAARVGVPAFYGMGNHDHRDAFRAELLDGGVAPAGTTAGDTSAGDQSGAFAPVDYVIELDGLRIVMVDSTVPGFHYGELTGEQRTWLADVLADTAPAGTLLTIHHPPFPAKTDGPDGDLMANASFRNLDDFADAVAGTDVMLVVSGHYHEPLAGRAGGVPVWAGPSTAMAHEISIEGDYFRIVPGSAVSVIDVFDDHTAVARAVNCLERPALFEMSMANLRDYVSQATH